MSDLSATNVDMEQAIDQAVKQFTKTLTEEVRRVFPLLVAAELAKLSGAPSGSCRNPNKLSKSELYAMIVSLGSEGKTHKMIAEQLGISESYVNKIKKAEGAKP